LPDTYHSAGHGRGTATLKFHEGRDILLPKAPPRFPSSVETRRRILQAIATGNEKYARPFDRGKVALASLIGTESWADYGNVVLQMAILDTLLSVEEKLGALTGPDDEAASGEEPAAGDDRATLG
jgi:hypothetical protein